MNKQTFFKHLNEQYEEKLEYFTNTYPELSTREDAKQFVKDRDYNIKCWVVGELLCDLTTYCDDLGDKWYRLLVLFIKQVHRRKFNYDEITHEEFMLCLNLLRGDNWGVNIYSCWIDWGKTNHIIWFDIDVEIKMTSDILKYCLEWLGL